MTKRNSPSSQQMNRIQKLLMQQNNQVKKRFSNHNVISTMLQTPALHAIIAPYLQKRRQRLYGVEETLSLFIT